MSDKKAVHHIELDPRIHTLLKRCEFIEGKSISDILTHRLLPYLQRYSHSSLAHWEEAEQREQMKNMLSQFEADNNFDPNHIPFDRQILGLRRNLDELEKEIAISPVPGQDLEKLRFKIIKDLNFAEKEALEREQQKRKDRALRWQEAVKKYPLD